MLWLEIRHTCVKVRYTLLTRLLLEWIDTTALCTQDWACKASCSSWSWHPCENQGIFIAFYQPMFESWVAYSYGYKQAGDTPLHEAFLDVAEFLIQGGAGVNITNKVIWHLWHLASTANLCNRRATHHCIQHGIQMLQSCLLKLGLMSTLQIRYAANLQSCSLITYCSHYQFGQTPLYLSGSSTLRTFAYGDCDLAAFLRTYKVWWKEQYLTACTTFSSSISNLTSYGLTEGQ